MRLEWLEDVVAVSETGSFSEAAERRHLTRSAFSRRIETIEEYVGVDLFDRTRKLVQLLDHVLDQREQIVRLAGMLRELVADQRQEAPDPGRVPKARLTGAASTRTAMRRTRASPGAPSQACRYVQCVIVGSDRRAASISSSKSSRKSLAATDSGASGEETMCMSNGIVASSGRTTMPCGA